MSIELLRVECRIVGIQRDADGQIIGAPLLADIVAYAAGLDEIPAEVTAIIGQANDGEKTEPTPHDGERR